MEKNKKNKKGQLKIQEMAFVLLAVVFLFALIFLFYVQFQTKAFSDQARILREERTIALLEHVSAMPELGCSGLDETICIDQDKLEVFHDNEAIQKNYEKLWKSAFILKIIVKPVYPVNDNGDNGENNKEFIVYKSDKTIESAETYSTFIPLCKSANTGKASCGIGRILITTEMPIK